MTPSPTVSTVFSEGAAALEVAVAVFDVAGATVVATVVVVVEGPAFESLQAAAAIRRVTTSTVRLTR